MYDNMAWVASDPADHIQVSSFYEIDHSKLPPNSPVQLNSIRVVLVNEKTRMRVSLRYPSLYSLKAYFNETPRTKPNLKKLPPLDEKYTLGSEVAAEALYRRIPPHEIVQKSDSLRFWMLPSTPSPSKSNRHTNATDPVLSKKVSLCSALMDSGMVKWGQRRRVMFLARHMEDKRQLIVQSTHDRIKGEEEGDPDDEDKVDANAETEALCEAGDEEEDEEEEGKESEKDQVKRVDSSKRKRISQARTKKTKMKKQENKNQIAVYKQEHTKLLKRSIDRWSAERYKLAEKNMLKVMKEQGAVSGNPILRPALRAEARKMIGDTGLLDHLLKHMAGKEAPGGEERFRRRHNADGAMEYWLEKANLVDIRKEAGVQDPYWIPPPGWKPGDNATQDPVCAREIKELKEDIAKIKMYV